MSEDHLSIVISRRYRGPPDSANGGYACGVLGCRLHGPARVRLDRPPPLDRPLTLRRAGERIELLDADVRVAEGGTVEAAWDVPPPVPFDVATQATTRFPWYNGHPFAGCFVCGPERDEGDGLRIFPGAIAERRVVGAPWVPADSVCDAAGIVQPEVVWAALDCPSWFGILAFEPGVRYALLGQLSARVIRRPSAHERCVVIGWASGREGRKLHGGTAIYDPDNSLLASASATWIELKDSPRQRTVFTAEGAENAEKGLQ
jgi:hypothetical protein